jgi:SAM-dependent methyltransferase
MRPEDVIPIYDREGPAWSLLRDRRLTERPWLDRALMIAPRAMGRRRILDLGCGAGRPLAAYLVERGCLVTGVDASRPMIDLFAANVPRAEALHADMRGLKLGRRFDLILAWDSFFHLAADEQMAMMPTFAAHAAPMGALLMTTGPAEGTALGSIGKEQLFHASLSPEAYRAGLEGVGFEVLGFWPEEPACGGRTIWLARARPEPPPAPR